MKYKDWLNEWLASYVRPTAKQKTYTRYSETVSTHIIPALGEYELNELTQLVLQRFTVELLSSGNVRTGKGLSPNSVNGVITVIQNSLRIAHNVGCADKYIANEIKRPRLNEKKVEGFSEIEQKKIEQAILCGKKPKMLGVLLCMYTGLRIGELLALEWQDFDLNKEQISVTKTCFDGRAEDGAFARVIDTPKTSASIRIIPIPRRFVQLLKNMKKQSKTSHFISSKGNPICVRVYQKSFERFLRRLRIPRKGFHALRHTFATSALDCGMDVKTLSEVLGHKNAVVTLNRYVHSPIKHKHEMMNRLGKSFTAPHTQG